MLKPQQKKACPMKPFRISSYCHNFHREERGATMTEFVITLPIFVTVFVGLSALFQLGKVSVATKTQAYKVWLEKVKTEEDNMGRITPRYTGLDAVESISGGAFDSLGSGDLLQIVTLADDVATFAAGHWGESYGRARLYGVLGGAPGTGTGNHALQEMKNLSDKPSGGQWLTISPNDIIGDAMLAKYVVNDAINFDDLSSDAGDAAGIASMIIGLLGGPQGLLAGTRYGNVSRQDTNVSKSVTVVGREFNFSAGYSSLLSPQPVDALVDDVPDIVTDLTGITLNAEQMQWLYIYAAAQTIDNYRVAYNMFAIEIDKDFEYTVEEYPAASRPAYDYNDWP